jgi:transposase-like protein
MSHHQKGVVVARSSDYPSLLAYFDALGVETDKNFLREALRVVTQLVMEVEVSAAIEAIPYERNRSRVAYRNGYRRRIWQTDLGAIPLRIPKLRSGTYYPSFMTTPEAAEQLLLALVHHAYVQGISMAGVTAFLRTLGLLSVRPNQIADICEQLDDLIYQFRTRQLQAPYPKLYFDLLDLQVTRPNGVERLQVAVAVGTRDSGKREILGFELVSTEGDETFWRAFLHGLIQRGLHGVEHVTGVMHNGLLTAMGDILGEAVERQPARIEKTQRQIERRSENSASPLVFAISTHFVDAAPFIERQIQFAEALLAYSLGHILDLNAVEVFNRVRSATTPNTDAIGMILDIDDTWAVEYRQAA